MTDIASSGGSGPRRSAEEDAQLWERYRGRTGADAKATPLHRLQIGGSIPARIDQHLEPVLPADRLRGEMLLKGVWRIGTDRLTLEDGAAPWGDPTPSKHYADRLHRFDWLLDLTSMGDAGEERARAMVDDWISNFGRFDGFSWRVGCTADRVWNWMRCGSALFDVGEQEFRDNRLEALARQIRHVAALADTEIEPSARWRSACIAVAGDLCLFEGRGNELAMQRLEAECTAQLLPDGGHVSRSPSRALATLADLIALRNLLLRCDRPCPDFLKRWISLAGGMVTFFRSGDGALPPFHDGSESLPNSVSAVLEQLESPPRRFAVAPKSGFQKLAKGETLLILDAGAAPQRPFGDRAHAGALSFELNDADARLITACGWSPELDLDFQEAVRRTSAHSTLIIEDVDSCGFVANDETRLLYPIGPEGISAKRLEEDDEIWLDAQHGGYKSQYGLLHRRRLFMSGDGKRLTGEDSLARPVSAGRSEEVTTIPFAIRFHLHPTVAAETAGDSILLQSEFGPRWRFKTSHSRAQLSDTVYFARSGVERSRQIVLHGDAERNSDGSAPPNCVRWAFLKDDANGLS
ncbi:MAG: heparinase II/III family protein [Pseudomonadota bacterium]